MFIDKMGDRSWFEPFQKAADKLENGFVYDFLGVKSDPKYNASNTLDSTAEARVNPIPINNVEFACLLWAVSTSGKTFTMAEMGAGFGIWSVRGAAAARNIGKNYKLISVEGEKTHFDWLAEHCSNNSLKKGQIKLVHGVVGANDGYCLFPISNQPDVEWGLRSLNVTRAEIKNIENSARLQQNEDGTYSLKKHLHMKYEGSKSYSIKTLLKGSSVIDFIHFDIQGSELEAITASMKNINKKVRIMYIATHSPEIEVGMRELLKQNGWTNLFDEPQKRRPNGYMGDGEQIWINDKFH